MGSVAPIQMAVLTAAFANGGDLLVPRVVRATRSDGVTTPTARQTSGRLPGSSAHFEQVRNGMRAAGRVLKAERLHIITQLGKGGSGGKSAEKKGKDY